MNDVQRHEALVPMGTQVSSKGRWRNCRGVGPDWIIGGDGAYVFDDQGKEWLDNSCGLGAVTLGHGIELSTAPACYPLPHKFELELAEKLNGWIPCAEMVRFLKSGTEATTACIRLARIFTGRDKVVDAGNYHGWADWTLGAEHEGVPQCVRDLTKRVHWRDLEELEEAIWGRDVAAVIMEPVSLIGPDEFYLPRAKELCEKYGTVLVFDEIITGIRMARGGAQDVYEVVPHLCAIGKGMANGYPISAVCGRRDIMECWSRTHMSGTHNADPSCMGAALENMERMELGGFWAHQADIGGAMLRGATELIVKHALHPIVKAAGHAHWWMVQIPDNFHQTLVQQTVMEHGILGSNGSHFVSLAHTRSDVTKTLIAYDHAFGVLREALDKGDVAIRLKCDVNKTVFRRNG